MHLWDIVGEFRKTFESRKTGVRYCRTMDGGLRKAVWNPKKKGYSSTGTGVNIYFLSDSRIQEDIIRNQEQSNGFPAGQLNESKEKEKS